MTRITNRQQIIKRVIQGILIKMMNTKFFRQFRFFYETLLTSVVISLANFFFNAPRKSTFISLSSRRFPMLKSRIKLANSFLREFYSRFFREGLSVFTSFHSNYIASFRAILPSSLFNSIGSSLYWFTAYIARFFKKSSFAFSQRPTIHRSTTKRAKLLVSLFKRNFKFFLTPLAIKFDNHRQRYYTIALNNNQYRRKVI